MNGFSAYSLDEWLFCVWLNVECLMNGRPSIECQRDSLQRSQFSGLVNFHRL